MWGSFFSPDGIGNTYLKKTWRIMCGTVVKLMGCRPYKYYSNYLPFI